MPRNKQTALDTYIGARLRLRRLLLGMSQENLADQLSITFQQVQKYEKGANRISSARLFEIAKSLSVPVNYFYEGLEQTDRTPIDGFEDDGEEFDMGVEPYLAWVSSVEGVELNNAFRKIIANKTRRHLTDLILAVVALQQQAKTDFD